MNKEILEKYADLILDAGINIKEGRSMKVASEPYHWEFTLLLQKKAYERGVCHFRAELNHPMMDVIASKYQKDEYLATVPSFTKSMVDTYIDENWSMVRLGGLEYPDLAKEIDQERNSIIQKAQRESLNPLSKNLLSGRSSWLLAALPTPGWAAKIFNQPASPELEKKLWEVLIPILRLDQPDPVAAWMKHSEILHARCQFMDRVKAHYLHFEGPETDLKVYMNDNSSWKGGACKTEDGRTFFPNLPTEEVFTTPNFLKTEGKVKVTRPVAVLADQVENAWFEFKNGQVINYGASYGKHLLDQYFKIDDKARFLGEVALVDASAPIFKSGLIFHSILFDENAACHIALGRGIAMSMNNSQGLSDDELDKRGCNKSLLHTDFMIGSPDINVTAVTASGEKVAVISNGRFVI